MESVDTLICAAHVVPVAPRGLLADHAVAISGGRIVAVLPTAQALERYEAREVVRLDRHALIPGLVNLHCHAAMTLMRGIADDVPLMTWLERHQAQARRAVRVYSMAVAMLIAVAAVTLLTQSATSHFLHGLIA